MGTLLEQSIEALVTPCAEELGLEIVRVSLTGDEHKHLQIMAERPEHQGLSVDDCASLSRKISDVLEVSDPIKDAYDLEVSSPGIDRPLTRPKDFEAFTGYDVVIRTKDPVDGQRKFRGILSSKQQDAIVLKLENGSEERTISFENIHAAKLVLTDALLKKAAQG